MMSAPLAAQGLTTPRTTMPVSYTYGTFIPALDHLFDSELHPIRSCLLAIRLFGLTPPELLRFDATRGLAQICYRGDISLPRRSSMSGWLLLRPFNWDHIRYLGQVAFTQGRASSTLAPGTLTRAAWRKELKQRGYLLGEALGVKGWLHDLRSAFACSYYALVLKTVPPVLDRVSAAPANEARVLTDLCEHLSCPAERLPAFIGARVW